MKNRRLKCRNPNISMDGRIADEQKACLNILFIGQQNVTSDMLHNFVLLPPHFTILINYLEKDAKGICSQHKNWQENKLLRGHNKAVRGYICLSDKVNTLH